MMSFALLERALAYADDTHTSSASIQELTRDSEVLVDLSSELGLSLNPAKTQLLLHGKVEGSEDVAIPPSKTLTLLGFTIDQKLRSPCLTSRTSTTRCCTESIP